MDWVDVQVLRDRFAMRTLQDGCEEALRDLVLGTFSLLRHTPAGVMGLNRAVHFTVEDDEAWHAIGHRLVPKARVWDEVLREPGTRSVAVQGKRPDQFRGYILVKLEPSSVVQPGVFVDVNDHFDVRTDGEAPPVAELMTILGEVWVDAVARAKKLVSHLMEAA
ncbi:MAG: hypothetical protein JXR37_30965 [Kiritimatiellae bacterium]|nr:hypothetical protein [Kiritimatiellia bacterium]